MTSSNRVAYSIGAASRLTGLSPDTLRVWERRYGVPRPGRSAGGSRSYEQDDIARLQLVARAVAAGHRAGNVASLSQPALERLLSTSREDRDVELPLDPIPAVESCVEVLRADDAVELRVRLRRAALLLGPRRFLQEVAHPLAVRVGELWERGEIGVRQEHLFTECLSTQLRVLLCGLEGTEVAPVVVLSTFPGELHGLGLEMVAVHLASRGAIPRLLGPNCPPEQIADAAAALRADVVGVSISAASRPRAAERDLRKLTGALGKARVSVWLGGAGARRVRALDRRVRVVRSAPEIDAAIAQARRGRMAAGAGSPA